MLAVDVQLYNAQQLHKKVHVANAEQLIVMEDAGNISKKEMIMKNLFILSTAILVILFGCASFESLTEEDRNVESVHTTKVEKDEAFNIVHEWFAKTYNSSNDVIQLADKDAGKIIGKGVGMYSSGGVGFMYSYTITVRVKDLKMKIEFYTGSHESSGYPPQKRFQEDILANYKNITNSLLAAFENNNDDDF